MRTVIIFDDCQANIRFFIVEKNLRHLDGIYINNTKDEDKIKEAELYDLIYDEEGLYNMLGLDQFPTDAIRLSPDCCVIVCGRVPDDIFG